MPSNDSPPAELRQTRLWRDDDPGASRVYGTHLDDREGVYHADRNCPYIGGTVVRGIRSVQSRTVAYVLTRWSSAECACSYCTLDEAEAFRNAVERGEVSPYTAKVPKDVGVDRATLRRLAPQENLLPGDRQEAEA